MKGLIAALCVLLSLVSVGNCFCCKQCWNLHRDTCCDEKVLDYCPYSSCMTASEYCVVEGKAYKTIMKTCGNPLFCDQSLLVTTHNDDFKVSLRTKCGNEENSNEKLNFLHPEELQPNGKTCPSCYSTDSSVPCDNQGKFVNCVEGQTECVSFNGTVQFSDGLIRNFAVKGCITEGGCKYGLTVLAGAKDMSPNNILVCTPIPPIGSK
ncbi:phospholipase A2 inhibitor gamma subunit B-like [Discoglossus pictus]